MKVAIEASNIRAGGGITHLVELLSAADSDALGLESVEVFSGPETLERLPVRPWLKPRLVEADSSWGRFVGQQRRLERELASDTDILLVPGGTYLGRFRPFVAMAQNLLPFDAYEREREGITPKGLRLKMLSWFQGRTFKQADGVIFMTEISRSQITRSGGFTPRRSCVVHHGTHARFVRAVRPERALRTYTHEQPFRILYVSILEPYKHQDVVVEAVGSLLQGGLPVALDLVGPGNPEDRDQLNRVIRRWDPGSARIQYHGMVPYERLDAIYGQADAFVFASSCETFGIILLEAMAGGLPIICSHRSAMPEVVGDAAVYFDPLDAGTLSAAIGRVLEDAGLRRTLAFQSRVQAGKFSWERCAQETFGFVRQVLEEHRQQRHTT